MIGDPSIDNRAFAELFGDQRLMAIFRGLGVPRSVELAERAWALGVDVVELPVQSGDDLDALRAVAAAGAAEGRVVGAGTVVDPTVVRTVAEAGARFTVSPGFDERVALASAQAGLPPLPGVATASEVQRAMALGLTWLKAFPASLLGVGWFAAMAGPFPDAIFVATGGMDASNAAEFLAGGARVVAVGSALSDPDQLSALRSFGAKTTSDVDYGAKGEQEQEQGRPTGPGLGIEIDEQQVDARRRTRTAGATTSGGMPTAAWRNGDDHGPEQLERASTDRAHPVDQPGEPDR